MLQSNHQHALSSWSYKSRTSSLITVSYLTCEENWSPNVEEDWLPRSHTHLSLSCGVCTPVYVPFPGSQTRNVWSLKKQWFQSEDPPTKKRNRSKFILDVILSALLGMLRQLFSPTVSPTHWNASTKMDAETRHWNYMARVPRQIPDTRNNARLWNTKDTKVTLQHSAPWYMTD